jgi:site-specific recombinase XerD
MFDRLFTYPHTLARHRNGPLVNERLAYLTHLALGGLSRNGLRKTAEHILVVADKLRLANRPGETISREEIERWAAQWATRAPGTLHRKGGPNSQFHAYAIRWLKFLGRFEQPPSPPSPYAEQIAAYADYMHSEQGLSARTVSKRCQFLQRFLGHFSDAGCLREITLNQIDEALMELIARGNCARITVRTLANHLRTFFRYAEMRQWCRKGLATAIKGPRVFAQESLPSGPSWDEVQQMLATSHGDRPAEIRDHAILMLLAVYGLRGGEVRALRLEDFAWESEQFFVADTKTRRTRRYPLSRPAGEAILRYLKQVRPRSLHRNLFLTLLPPFRPMTDLWPIVGRHLRRLAPSLRHHGPHALRHACATHLMAEGHSLTEIGDYLGHRQVDSTRIYAKVDLAGLRQVAAFDLGGLL